MKNKMCIIASLMAVGISSTTLANVGLSSHATIEVLSTGFGIEKPYNMSITENYVSDVSDPTEVKVINTIPENQPVIPHGLMPLHPPLLELYTKKHNSLKGTLNLTFTATFSDTDVFTNTYTLDIDDNGNLTVALDDLPNPQNGVVCEFITTPAEAGSTASQITIQCQDYNS